MGIPVVIVQIDDAAGDIGAVIAGTLQTGQQIAQMKPVSMLQLPCWSRRMWRVRS